MRWFLFWALKCSELRQTSRELLVSDSFSPASDTGDCSSLFMAQIWLFFFFFTLRVLSACCFSSLSPSAGWIRGVYLAPVNLHGLFVAFLSSYFPSDSISIVYTKRMFGWRALWSLQFGLILISGCHVEIYQNSFCASLIIYRHSEKHEP